MTGITLSQTVFLIVAVPAMMWAMASVATAGGSRHSIRSLSPQCIWIHQTAVRHSTLTLFGMLLVVGVYAAARLAGSLG